MTRRVARWLVRRTFRQLISVVALLAGPRRALPQAEGTATERILVIRLDLLGDVVVTLPLVASLRAICPAAEITMLTLPYTAPIASMCPTIDRVLTVDSNRIRTVRGLIARSTWREYFAVWRDLRQSDFDLVLSVYGEMASLWSWLSGGRRTVGFEGEAYPRLLSDPVAGGRHHWRMHEIEYGRRLAECVDVATAPTAVKLSVPRRAVAGAQGLLDDVGIAADEPLVIVHAGSVNGSAKRWPVEQWARFADRVTRETGAHVILIGAASDRLIADEVVRLSDVTVRSLAGRTTIEQLAALLARADVVVSGDSGPLHLAAALGRPVVAVYGPTDPQVYGPHRAGGPAVVLRADIPCSPCYTLAATAECPLGNPICMHLVSVEQMVHATKDLLEGRQP